MRRVASVPTEPFTLINRSAAGILLSWLITPPVDPTPELHTGWTFQHLHLIQVEVIPVVTAKVTYAVQINVITRGKSTNREIVSLCAHSHPRQC